jgi:hypothetical protein
MLPQMTPQTPPQTPPPVLQLQDSRSARETKPNFSRRTARAGSTG